MFASSSGDCDRYFAKRPAQENVLFLPGSLLKACNCLVYHRVFLSLYSPSQSWKKDSAKKVPLAFVVSFFVGQLLGVWPSGCSMTRKPVSPRSSSTQSSRAATRK